MPKLTLQAKQVLNETMRAAMRRETLALLRTLPAENLTMELLAERLGVAKGTLYNYYQNKQELITDALHGIHLQVAEEITAVATNTELPPDEKILGYTGILFDNFNRYREIYATICSTEKEIDFQDRQRAQNIRRFLDEFARELTRGEFSRLVAAAARRGKERLALILEAVGSTGVRVSEVQYFTVEAARRGIAEISLKGKVRTILLPGRLCRKLLQYAQKQKIASGGIFLTRSGRNINRKQIWAEMKALCKFAGVSPEKVFPHNLRHLFARAFYSQTRDVVKLADVLGHSSLATTRIYLISTGAEHRRELERLRLIR